MKISHFPDFFPDETVYSVISRYMDRIQIPSNTIVNQHFFGKNSKSTTNDLPSNLEHLIDALPPFHTYTADMIIDQHTLFPLYAPFLPSDRALTLRERMRMDGTAAYWIAGIITSNVQRSSWLRYCPTCIENDRLVHGECYWHRLHQVPGILVCPIHKVMLEESQGNMAFGNGISHYSSAELSARNSAMPIADSHLREVLILLANNVKWLLENPVSVKPGYIQQQYRTLLTTQGFLTATDKLRCMKIKEAISNYYSIQLLDDLGCNILSKENWLTNWTIMQHPLHHLLFLQFLCGTIQEFFTRSQRSFTPFGYGPWPCLNPLCPNYREFVIRSYTVRQGTLNHPIATFICGCGFGYSRTGPDMSDEAIFRIGKISQYGGVWNQHLNSYWLDPNISTLQVARLMHTDVESIRRQAARLNLPFAPEIPRRGKRPRVYQDTVEEQRNSYRLLWLENLNRHPNMGYKKIVASAHKAYSWLNRHDRVWLKDHWPPANLSSRNTRLIAAKTRLKYENYSSNDEHLAKIIREAVNEEINSNTGFPVQITRMLLVARTGRPVLLRKSNTAFKYLPLAAQALNDSIETNEAFIWRKLGWAVQNYLAEQVYPSYYDFRVRARIGSSTSKHPLIQKLIQVAYGSLSMGVSLSTQMPDVSWGILNEGDKEIACDSFMAICIKEKFLLVEKSKSQIGTIYNIESILLLTIAAVVNNAENCNAIALWGYQNEKFLHQFGLPKGRLPNHSTLQKIYTKLDVKRFEIVLEQWLNEAFPGVQKEFQEIETYVRNVYVPGIQLLRSYRHIASAVVAKLC